MARTITDPEVLIRRLELPMELLPGARAAAHRFALRVPPAYLALMHRGDPTDPLLRQILACGRELVETPGFVDDPVGDLDALRGGGILSKYQGRALLIATAACAVHCRYCFRRAFPYTQHQAGRGGWHQALERLEADPDIHEVILSGGDPLSLDDGLLDTLLQGIEGIAHIRRLRIHTRLPVVVPRRVTPALVALLGRSRLGCVTVLHFNHPRELSDAARGALEALRPVCTLLNQSVLLRGVNDDVQTLAELNAALFDSQVLPYYIHLLDPVRGAAHFKVDEPRARQLMEGLRVRLPGYLVPRLVKEEPGTPAKTLIA
jgi:EF-P beta-lysylation protein EpmB